jgi:Ulp1 family protease
MSYACMRSYHWILLIIRVDAGRVDIMDSLAKNPEEYSNLIYMLQR